jgi:hypothetical protein
MKSKMRKKIEQPAALGLILASRRLTLKSIIATIKAEIRLNLLRSEMMALLEESRRLLAQSRRPKSGLDPQASEKKPPLPRGGPGPKGM